MEAIARRLLFRIGTVGFCLDLNELIEIREKIADQIDARQFDQQLSIVGALSFRRTIIPVINLADKLGIPSVDLDVVLVLNSQEGNWGLLVSQVEGFFPASEMIDHPIPRLLMAEGWRCFEHIALYAGKPYLRLDLSACYAGVD